jgi:hypothetical protein
MGRRRTLVSLVSSGKLGTCPIWAVHSWMEAMISSFVMLALVILFSNKSHPVWVALGFF